MKVRYRPAALAQLDDFFSYIAKHSPRSARRVIATIKVSIERLAVFPLSGRESEVPGIREWPIVRYPYIVFYTVDDLARAVIILRIRHTSQDPELHLDQV